MADKPIYESDIPWYRRTFGWLFGPNEPEKPQTPTPLPTTPEPAPEPTPPSVKPTFPTQFASNNETMMRQLEEAKRYRGIIEEASRQYNLRPSVLCGIGSRESHWGLALTPPNPGGRGDFANRTPRGVRRGTIPNDGPGYGRGIMQIDYDWHEFARTGPWGDPRENVFYACKVLDDARTFFNRRARLNEDEELRAILAAYNAGATATLRAIQAGKDIDAATTGKDYSRDVLNRSGWFQLHDWY